MYKTAKTFSFDDLDEEQQDANQELEQRLPKEMASVAQHIRVGF